jgi:Lrp/AsnC family leucine-responsive transcriptional regulator
MKRLRFKNGPVDEVDVALIRALAEDARTPMAELARSVGLSAPSVAERVRRLEEAGIIRGYGARIDPAALGLPLAAYVRVRPMPGQLRKAVEVLSAIDAVVECDRVTGEDCFIAKVHVRSVEELEAVIDRVIPYAMTNTSIIQSSPVSRRLPPLPAG